MRKVKLVLTFICVFGLALSGGLFAADSRQDVQDVQGQAIEYFRQVAELVIKKDAPAIYERMTPAVKQKFTVDQLADFLNKALGGLDQPETVTLTGYQMQPDGFHCIVQGLIKYPTEKVVLTLTLKRSFDGFLISHLNINFPEMSEAVRKRLQAFSAGAEKFLKNTFFPTLQGKGVDAALELVDDDVRKQVGDDLIKSILVKLKPVKIEKLIDYNKQEIAGNEKPAHRFVFEGLSNGTVYNVEIILQPEGNSFKVVDVNLYQRQ